MQAVNSSISGDRSERTKPSMLSDMAASKGKELGDLGWTFVQYRKQKSVSPQGDGEAILGKMVAGVN